ncbi:nitrogen regulatory protein pii [Lucifera butyrica]|uniref:Nitrogen regulatory protein pii n=1 Tax=Lucifera butyrica TaxID=1351585 RepID=A0A498R953_9FIRM|nr:P-II family nitrogen regulator [Lucifera butyrica]VBB07460.1 nitrogen regulatory protein pii [Lucifera butyrica]
MKEIIAVVRMDKTGATKRALVEAGAAGFTAFKVLGRGKLVEDKAVIADRKADLMARAYAEDDQETERLIEGFLDGTRLFPRRLFTVMAQDDAVPQIVDAIIRANKTDKKVGDGKIFVLPVLDLVRVRTGESGDNAI